MMSPMLTRSAVQKAKPNTRSMNRDQQSKQQQKLNNDTKSNTSSSISRGSSLAEVKRKARLNLQKKQSDTIVKDIYQTAMDSENIIIKQTGIIYDPRMTDHYCLWDEGYPENPDRFTHVIQRCESLGLLERCLELTPEMATKQQVLLKHTDEHYETLRATNGMQDADKLEDISSHYDAIYIHPTTFELSLLSVGCTIKLVEAVLHGQVQNGMAIIRPPGHHAMKTEFNGYCFFNNVAIAAQSALNKGLANRILIVDWDVHHGQGVQRMFYDDPRVLYFSIHRFEYGTFWPNLRESDFDYIGQDAGMGFNFNVPLNATGMQNADYLAIFQQLLMPVACEFQPDLVIVSAGYDAALGCPEGEMEIHPNFYPHLLAPLMSLAEGKVAVVLEGGYCLESLAEGAALTLRALLGDPAPLYADLESPSESVQESILNCIHAHRPYWNCLQFFKLYTLEEINNISPPQPDHYKVVHKFIGGEPLPERFPTRNCYPVQDPEFVMKCKNSLLQLKINTRLTFPAERVCYVYDIRMLSHENAFEDHPEKPERILKVYERFEEFKLLSRMKEVSSRHATEEEILLVHDPNHVIAMKNVVKNVHKLNELADNFNSVYFHPKTFECATLAAGSVLQMVDNVLNLQCRSGVCVIRPPGHHAEPDQPQGFCIFNNIAIAAEYAIKAHGLKRVLIVDWDVHHGNGTQHIFEDNPNVLYISIHRYDNGTFFPNSTNGNYTVVGSGAGEGFNVNIPWNRKGMGDLEYVTAFQRIILPIAYEFNPELVLISAGFDAAIGDPLGGCKVSPEAYGHFTYWLSSLANGRVIICLEGGYNVNSVSYALTMCTKALLGDPVPKLNTNTMHSTISVIATEAIYNVMTVHQKYWKSIKFNKKLPDLDTDRPATFEALTHAVEKLSLVQKTAKIMSHSDNEGKEIKKVNQDGAGTSGTNETAGPSQSRTSNEARPQRLVDFLAENIHQLANEEMYAVVPLMTCPHIRLLARNTPPTRINTHEPCSECSSTQENWICLHCYVVLCGRYVNEHMLYHYLNNEDHPLTLSFADLSIWCYTCEAYIDNPDLFVYKNLAHRDKFGEEMVWPFPHRTPTITVENQQSNI